METLPEAQREALEALYQRLDSRSADVSGAHAWWPCPPGIRRPGTASPLAAKEPPADLGGITEDVLEVEEEGDASMQGQHGGRGERRTLQAVCPGGGPPWYRRASRVRRPKGTPHSRVSRSARAFSSARGRLPASGRPTRTWLKDSSTVKA
jgi:hypothetical protein